MQKKWDVGSILGLRRSPGGGHGDPLQYSCLENTMESPRDHTVRHSWRDLAHMHVNLKI